MRDDLPDVPALRAHEPPPGGLAALRERLDAPPRRRWWLASVPVLALALAIALLVARRASPPHVVPPPDRSALPEPAIARTDVTFYWVASSPTPQSRTETPAVPTVAPAVSIADAPRVNFGIE